MAGLLDGKVMVVTGAGGGRGVKGIGECIAFAAAKLGAQGSLQLHCAVCHDSHGNRRRAESDSRG